MKIENTNDLQVLLHTARTGNLTQAAAVMGITPAAASAMLKRLEKQLSTRLFERSTRVMRLTQDGHTLLDHAQRAFELLAEGEAHITEQHSQLMGSIRVAAPSDLTRSVLLNWLDEFLALHPQVQLSLNVGDKTLDVIRDEVDLAIRYGELVDSRLVIRPLAKVSPLLTASPKYLKQFGTPLHPQDLPQHRCLVFGRGGRLHTTWKFAQNGQWTQVHVSAHRTVDDASIAREWALAGHGILLKTHLHWGDIHSGGLVQLLPDWQTEPYPLHVVLPSGRFLPLRVRALVDFLCEKFSAQPQSGS